ncbi:MAG: formylglycine-generating enzyme family protein [Rhodospirillaceae bacterium]|nr:formylglycine-generating enzyme family protein [Rhodospirillaceae bacterium]
MRRFGIIIGVVGVALWLADAAVAQPRSLTDCPTCPEMVVIPSGTLSMGTTPSALELDRTGRGKAEAGIVAVAINQSFALGRTEVTRAQYEAFVKATNYAPKVKFCRVWDQTGQRFTDVPNRTWRDTGLQTLARDDHPVTCVSWDDAQAYVKWLSEQTNKRYRLPSESEWEYAARGGQNKRRFWGDDPADGCAYANIYDLTARRAYPLSWTHVTCADGFADLAPVASLLPNAYGLHDMIGNVWEWVGDCFTTSKIGRPKDQRAWTWDGCTDRALRGGSWMTAPDRARVAFPAGDPHDDRYVFLGFRVARDLTEDDK